MMMAEEIFVEETESTMDMARQAIDEGLSVGGLPVLFRAERQTHGRGTHGRNWESVSGNVHMTAVIPLVNVRRLGMAPLEVGLTVHTVLSRILRHIQPSLFVFVKWPNDLLSRDGRKLSGALLETHRGHLLVGIGINVTVSPQIEPQHRKTTCIADLVVSSAVPSAKEIAAAVFSELVQRLTAPSVSQDMVVAEWSALADWTSPVYRRDIPSVPLRALGLTSDGMLRVAFPDGHEDILVDQYLL